MLSQRQITKQGAYKAGLLFEACPAAKELGASTPQPNEMLGRLNHQHAANDCHRQGIAITLQQ